jgi:hypothetical protein
MSSSNNPSAIAIKLKAKDSYQICSFASYKTEGVWEQGAEENIWTEEGWSDGRLEESA